MTNVILIMLGLGMACSLPPVILVLIVVKGLGWRQFPLRLGVVLVAACIGALLWCQTVSAIKLSFLPVDAGDPFECMLDAKLAKTAECKAMLARKFINTNTQFGNGFVSAEVRRWLTVFPLIKVPCALPDRTDCEAVDLFLINAQSELDNLNPLWLLNGLFVFLTICVISLWLTRSTASATQTSYNSGTGQTI